MIGKSFTILLVSEIFASAIGFGVMILLARRLGPVGFADFEYAAVVAAWWLVVVRGGFDTIVYREAARRPRLIRPLTNLLIGLRGASALVALIVVVALASVSSPDRGRAVALAGLLLIPSALATDVGLRANCRFGGLALAQAIRALGFALGVLLLVGGSGDATIAVACLVMAEYGSMFVLWWIHGSEQGPIQPRFRRRPWIVVARRSAIAGVSRFSRVSLYSVDLLIIGSLATPAILGPYAAGRRVVFALLSLGLVVPAAVAPRIAKVWANGSGQTQSFVAMTLERMLLFVLPATAGLMMTADRWMTWLFGETFVEGGPWLSLIALRLPFVIVSNIQQSALIACRREVWALRLTLGMVALTLVVVTPMALFQGVWGVAWGVLAVEVCGAFAGWVALSRLGIAPRWDHSSLPAVVGCLALVIVCRVGTAWPLAMVVIVSAAAYTLVASLVEPIQRMVLSSVSRKLLTRLSGGPLS